MCFSGAASYEPVGVAPAGESSRTDVALHTTVFNLTVTLQSFRFVNNKMTSLTIFISESAPYSLDSKKFVFF